MSVRAFALALVFYVPATAVARDAVQFLNSGKVLPKDLPFSEATRVGNTLYLSGQIGIVPGKLELVPGGIEPEARQTMTNIRTTLEAHGHSMRDVFKCTVMLADMAEWPAFNAVYKTFFDAGRYPARSALGANGLALGARVEVECTAARSGGGPSAQAGRPFEPTISRRIGVTAGSRSASCEFEHGIDRRGELQADGRG